MSSITQFTEKELDQIAQKMFAKSKEPRPLRGFWTGDKASLKKFEAVLARIAKQGSTHAR